jgi:heme A synthase
MAHRRFVYFSWSVLVYTLGIIVWGAFVRATGSGAGCGSHWPLCNGVVVPRSPSVETLIEFSHRVSSGIALPLVIGLVVAAFRLFPKRHVVRRGAVASLVLMIIEALIGAGLVLFELVADNASVARALWMSVHLANTFLLVAALTLTAWWASGGRSFGLRNQGAMLGFLLLGCAATLMLGVSGAIAALGDTLFPSTSLAQALRDDFSSTAHILIQLRKYHPLIAFGTAVYLVVLGSLARLSRPSPETRRFSRALVALFVLQLGVGSLNVVLLAPIPMQLIHLLLADIVWIVLILLTASTLAEHPAQSAERSAQRVEHQAQRA